MVRRPTVSFVVPCGGQPAIHRVRFGFALFFQRMQSKSLRREDDTNTINSYCRRVASTTAYWTPIAIAGADVDWIGWTSAPLEARSSGAARVADLCDVPPTYFRSAKSPAEAGQQPAVHWPDCGW